MRKEEKRKLSLTEKLLDIHKYHDMVVHHHDSTWLVTEVMASGKVYLTSSTDEHLMVDVSDIEQIWYLMEFVWYLIDVECMEWG